MSARRSRRTWLIQEARHPESGAPLGHYDREALLDCMTEVETLLYMVGGMVAFTSDRVKIGDIAGEPLAETRQVIVQWQPQSPMREEEDQQEHAAPAAFAEPDRPEDDPELEAEPEPEPEEALT